MHEVLEGFGLGFVGGFVPGSILTILLISVIQGGFASGIRAFFISLFAEIVIVGILLFALVTLSVPDEAFLYVGVLGGLVLFYFGSQVLRIQSIEKPEDTRTTFTPAKIFILAATNAPLYIFWLTICAPLIWQMSQHYPLVFSAAWFIAAFEIGWSLSTFAVLMAFVKMRQHLTNPHIMRKVYLGIALFMFLLGVRMLYTSISALIA